MRLGWNPSLLSLVGPIGIAGWLGLAGVAIAAPAGPVAFVESIAPASATVAPFTYVPAGTTVALGMSGVLVIDYFSSCTRETITGGNVVIGGAGSTIRGGKVTRSSVDCRGDQIQTALQLADQAGATVSRGFGAAAPGTKPALIIGGTRPLVTATETGELRIERIDTKAPAIILAVPALPDGRPGPLDFAKLNKSLAPGGLYLATLGGHRLVFQVDAAASADALLLDRLLPI